MPKLLVEFLKEQQEPFCLDVYLLERGYNSSKNARRFLKKRGAIRKCSKIVKAVFGRLVLHNDERIKNCGNEDHEDVFSSESGTTMYNSCSESDVEDYAHFSEVDAERDLKWRSIENDNNEQLSPISVLEETHQIDEGSSPFHQIKKLKPSYSIVNNLSTEQHNSKTTQEHEDSNSYPRYIINKRAMQQSKKLLVDCVREVIENQRRKDDKNGEQLKKILGSDELWKLVCENVWAWSQDSIHKTNIPQLLHYDFMNSEKQWSSAFEEQRNEICNKIGDAILEDIVNEIVTS